MGQVWWFIFKLRNVRLIRLLLRRGRQPSAQHAHRHGKGSSSQFRLIVQPSHRRRRISPENDERPRTFFPSYSVDINDQELKKLKTNNNNREKETLKPKPKVNTISSRPASWMVAPQPHTKNSWRPSTRPSLKLTLSKPASSSVTSSKGKTSVKTNATSSESWSAKFCSGIFSLRQTRSLPRLRDKGSSLSGQGNWQPPSRSFFI